MSVVNAGRLVLARNGTKPVSSNVLLMLSLAVLPLLLEALWRLLSVWPDTCVTATSVTTKVVGCVWEVHIVARNVAIICQTISWNVDSVI